MKQSFLIPHYFIEILFWILVAELILIVFLLFTIIYVKIWNVNKEKQEEATRRKIAKGIMEYMKGKIPLEDVLSSSGDASKILLLKELETFNQRFSGEDWDNVKKQIAENYLLPLARKSIGSRKWLKRAFAARCFALSPLNKDKDYILKLFDDSNFQVESLIISAIIHLKIKEGVIKILESMSHNSGYFRYYYLDTLVSAKSQEIFDWIEEIAQSIPNRKLHLACLDVLSGKMQVIQGSFLTRDVNSPYEEIRLSAIKVLARNPQKDSLEVLLNHVDDPIVEIRIESYRGLEHFRSPQTLQALEKGLSDSNWGVRIQAANSLKNMGRAGLAILNKQNAESEPKAYEVAHYILQLDW